MASAQGIYTTGDVAKLCNVRKMTVVRWANRGELPAHKLPGRGDRRITHDDLVAFMERNGFPLPESWRSDRTDVLVVEDDQNLAKAIQAAMRGAGYNASVAYNGFTAGAMLARLTPRLVTLDLSMPGMSGFEVLRYIRQRDEFVHTRVVVVSALPKPQLEKALEMGADAALAKPFRQAELIDTVRDLLSVA